MHRIALLFLLFFSTQSIAQQKNYAAYTTNDGLPSNFIYRCLEDNKGFLWIATDAGVARFDGKYFQTFTTEQGLPDNEVLEMVKDKDGTIWVDCFKQSPAYFDEKKNRFISAKDDSDLAKVSSAYLNYLSVLDNGVEYRNEKAAYVFVNKKLQFQSPALVTYIDKDSYIAYKSFDRTQNGYAMVFQYYYQNKLVDSAVADTMPSSTALRIIAVDKKSFYIFNASANPFAEIITPVSYRPLRFKTNRISLPASFSNASFSGDYFFISANNGKVYMYDKITLQLKYTISGDYLPNACYIDSKGNTWVNTLDKGLLVYRKANLGSIKMPGNFTNTNFMSIARKPDGTLLAGNYYGQVVEVKNNTFHIHNVVNRKPSRLRKILLKGNDVYTISDGLDGIFKNYTIPFLNLANKEATGGKAGVICNDTLLLVGTGYAIVRMNIPGRKMTALSRYRRVTAMVKANDSIVYIGSLDGLHKYNFIKDSYTSLTQANPLLTERIMDMAIAADGTVCIATANNGIVLLKNDSVTAHITMKDGILSNSCRTITTGKPGQIWLGTSQGISIINYKSLRGKNDLHIKNLTVNDGLTNNVINDMVYANDTVYAATSKGISVIPASANVTTFNIPVYLIKMDINEQDTVISNHYKLGYQRQNIQMQFGAVELNGHFKNLQYSIDDTSYWTNMATNVLTIQLSSGKHTLHVRAVDVNGNISNKQLIISFDVATPFWKSWWFWIPVAVLIQLLAVYFINRSNKKRKEAKLAEEIANVQTASLEQQAFTSLMNPHFMFNALNNIQHYINQQDRQNANRYLSDFASLIRKNFEAAQLSFIPLEQELENIKIYLRLEQMRFAHRFTYEINIDENIDTDEWMIPTMMLQPLLENALLHGIIPSAIAGELTIDIAQANNQLMIVITDNGIGIENSKALKTQSSHKSRGMELIRKRIAALNRFVRGSIVFNILPAFESIENPGTRITLNIPDDLYTAWKRVQGWSNNP